MYQVSVPEMACPIVASERVALRVRAAYLRALLRQEVGFFDAQANPGSLPHPDLSSADPTEIVARHVLDLDRSPRPERSLRWKWKLLGVLGSLFPRLSDRLLIKRLGGGWQLPRR